MIRIVFGLALALLMSAEIIASEESKEQAEEEKKSSSAASAAPVAAAAAAIAAQEAESAAAGAPTAVVLYPSAVLFPSDEKPKSKCAFRLDLSEVQEWHSDYKIIKIQKAIKYIDELFLQRGMIKLPGHYYFGSNSNFFVVYGKFVSKKLTDCVSVDVQYSVRSRSSHLNKVDVHTYLITDYSKLWYIDGNKKEENNLITKKKFMEGSWNFISATIRWTHYYIANYKGFEKPKEAVFCKHFYERVRKKGLENSLHRVAIVVNDDRNYSFNALYSTKEEEKKCTNFLLSTFGDLFS